MLNCKNELIGYQKELRRIYVELHEQVLLLSLKGTNTPWGTYSTVKHIHMDVKGLEVAF